MGEITHTYSCDCGNEITTYGSEFSIDDLLDMVFTCDECQSEICDECSKQCDECFERFCTDCINQHEKEHGEDDQEID